MKNSGKNIRSGICLFLGLREKGDNYKYVQLELSCVAGPCKGIYSNENSGKNIRLGICLFLGLRKREGNYKYVQLEISCVAGHAKEFIPMKKMWQEY